MLLATTGGFSIVINPGAPSVTNNGPDATTALVVSGNTTASITGPAVADNVPEIISAKVILVTTGGNVGTNTALTDLVAPGEKIGAPIPGAEMGVRLMDGTSMATPHVSGAAALLIARHRELAGQPEKIKRILCNTATDLGRERNFQGHGMVDILRALQAV